MRCAETYHHVPIPKEEDICAHCGSLLITPNLVDTEKRGKGKEEDGERNGREKGERGHVQPAGQLAAPLTGGFEAKMERVGSVLMSCSKYR